MILWLPLLVRSPVMCCAYYAGELLRLRIGMWLCAELSFRLFWAHSAKTRVWSPLRTQNSYLATHISAYRESKPHAGYEFSVWVTVKHVFSQNGFKTIGMSIPHKVTFRSSTSTPIIPHRNMRNTLVVLHTCIQFSFLPISIIRILLN